MEKRSKARMRVALQATVYVAGLPSLAGYVRDLSEEGAYIHSDHNGLYLGQSVGLDLLHCSTRLAGRPLGGVVVRVDRDGFALRFERCERELRSQAERHRVEERQAALA